MRPDVPPSRRAAFTLIELLVVISIIGLLTALTLPILGNAIGSGKEATCRSRLRQWAMAFQMYAGNWNNSFPHIDGLDRNKGPADHSGWVDVLPPYMGLKPWRESEKWKFPRQNTIFQCPSAILDDDKEYWYYPRRDGFFSYAMNSCLELDGCCWAPYGGASDWPMPAFLHVDEIVNPSRVILLFDQLLTTTRAYGGSSVDKNAGKYCGSYPKDFSTAHARRGSKLGGSILFCDYHVEWRETVWKPGWVATLEVPPRNDPDWFPYPPDQ